MLMGLFEITMWMSQDEMLKQFFIWSEKNWDSEKKWYQKID